MRDREGESRQGTMDGLACPLGEAGFAALSN